MPTIGEQLEVGLLPPVRVQGQPALQRLVDRMEEERVPGLSVAVIEDAEIVFTGAWGVLEAGSDTPVTDRTLFQAASISKPVTAAAALTMADKGELTLQGPIDEALRSWQLPASDLTARTPVTLQHLLSHTGGTTVHGFRGYAEGEELPTAVQVLQGVPPANSAAVVVDQAPGTAVRYSGGGTTIVQQAIVDVRGAPYANVLQKLVLGPMGMADSTFAQPLPSDRRAQAASGHRPDGSVVVGKWHTYPEQAAAGLWTTPSDLARFVIAVQQAANGQPSVLSAEVAQQLTQPVQGTTADGVALGTFLAEDRGVAQFAHGGANEGFRAQMMGAVDGSHGLVIMTNSDRGSVLFDEIIRTLSARDGWPGLDEPIVPMAVDADGLDAVAGRYRNEAGELVVLVRQGEELVRAEPMGERTPLVPTADGFVSTTDGWRVQRQADGTVRIDSLREDSEVSVASPTTEPPTALEWLAQGQLDEAVEACRTAATDEGSGCDEASLNQRGYVLLGQGDTARGVMLLQMVATAFPDSSNAHDSHGEALAAAGKTEAAIAAYERALALLDADPRVPASERTARRDWAEGKLLELRAAEAPPSTP